MKKKILLIGCVIVSLTAIVNCTKDEPVPEISGELLNTPVCNETKSGSTDEVNTPSVSCVGFIYEKSSKTLYLNQTNTTFNCCPGTISVAVSLSNDTIVVTQKEEDPSCFCSCMYSLNMKATGIENKQYAVRIEKQSLIGEEPFLFNIDLNTLSSGSVCQD